MTGRGAWRRATGAALAAMAALALAAVPATAEPDPTASPDAGTAGITVQITGVSPAVLEPGQDLDVAVTLRNDTGATVEHPAAQLAIWRYNLAARSDLTAWASGAVGSGRVAVRTPAEEPLDPGQSVSLHLTLPAAHVGLLDTPDAWGVRGIAVEGTADGAVLGIQRTFVLWLPTQATAVPQASLSVLVPVTGPATTPVTTPPDETQPAQPTQPTPPGTATDAAVPPTSPADGTTATPPASTDEDVDATAASDLQALTASGGRLEQTLAVLAADPVVGAAVDPRLVTQARAAGGSAASWADSLASALAGHDVATLPWADVDAAATVHAGQPGLTEAAVDRSNGSDLAGNRIGTLLWAPTKPDARTAALVPRSALAAMVTPVGSAATAAAQRQAVSAVQSVPTDAGDARLLVPDPLLTALFTAPTTVEPGATTTTASQRLLAELAVLARRDDPSPVALVAPDRTWQPDAALVSAELAALRSAPWVSLASISTLLGSSDDAPVTKLAKTTVDKSELAPSQVDRLASARERAEAFAGVTSDPDASMRDVDDLVLAPLAVAWRADPQGRDALVDAVDATVVARTSGLSIAPLSDLNVISARSELRVTVRNTLQAPATVHLVVSPRKACLRAERTDPLTVDANDERNVVVVLHATANCEVTVSAQLTNPDGQVVSEPVTFLARVAPTIESVGTIVVGILLAIGLVLGIVRTVRRGQSARRGARLQAEAARDDAPVTLAPLGGVGDPRPEEPRTTPAPDADAAGGEAPR